MAISTFALATVVNVSEQRRQNKKIEAAQEKQQQVDIASQNEEAARARRATIKEAMVKRAQIENIAGATGQTKSSAVTAGTTQITGDVAENIGNINTALSLSRAGTAAEADLFKAQQTSPLQTLAGVTQQASIAFKS